MGRIHRIHLARPAFGAGMKEFTMKTRIGLCAAVAVLSVATAAHAEENPFAGKWATAAVYDVDVPESTSVLKKLAASAVNSGTSGGSLSSNNTQQAAPTGPELGTFKGEQSEPAIAIEIKVDNKGKSTIVVSEIKSKPSYAVKKLKVEEATVTAEKLDFLTTEKSDKVLNTIRWVGEITDPTTLMMTRQTKSGNPIDDGPLMFVRAK
jgi:hypothetical protein